jgi:hypothetical protein
MHRRGVTSDAAAEDALATPLSDDARRRLAIARDARTLEKRRVYVTNGDTASPSVR